MVLEAALGPILFSVSRVDLFADFQGWMPTGDDRQDFLGRAQCLTTFEEGQSLTGLQFGKRSSGTVSARLYDKTREIAVGEGQHWHEIWGERFDSSLPVLRVEFEIAREALTQFGVSTPEEIVSVAGAVWANLTEEWLTHRARTADSTRSRWPVSSYWRDVQHASIRGNALGIPRIYRAQQVGYLDGIAPQLVGYLASAAVYTGCDSLRDVIPEVVNLVHRYEDRTGLTFAERVTEKRREKRLL